MCVTVAATLLAVLTGPAMADWVTATVPAGTTPNAVAVNPVTNKIYAVNYSSNNVTVIDGATNDTTLVPVSTNPYAVAVNPVTNKVYVANINSNNVTVIDGATNTTTTVPAGTSPVVVAVNPVTNRIYVANYGSNSVTTIDGATNDTTTVATLTSPGAVAVNPVTNRIYVANQNSNNMTVIDGATNGTTTVPTEAGPRAVAVNPVTDKIYVANYNSGSVTVIDGSTDDTTTVPAGSSPRSVAVNPVTNKVYVANAGSNNVTVIDGATNTMTMVPAGITPLAVAVNPATNKTYVANQTSGNVTVIADAPANDTKVRAAFDRLPGDTTVFARPALTGKGVNRSTPYRTTMMGVGNWLGTAQADWSWATVNSGAGTDSVAWSYNWGADSLIMGENLVCCVPLEDQAATTNNLGLGSPFAGDLEVYPVYRMEFHAGQNEAARPEVRVMNLPTIVRGVLPVSLQPTADGSRPDIRLLDVSGRKVAELHPGANDVSRLAPGVYFCTFSAGDYRVTEKLVLQR